MYRVVKNGKYWTGLGWSTHETEAYEYTFLIQAKAAATLTGGTIQKIHLKTS